MENGNSELLNDVKWNCRHCTRSFDSRGKRNGHFNKEHRKKCIINGRDIEQSSVKRSEQNKFVCPCGKAFLHAQSLQRHFKSCIGSILMDEDDLESIEHEERNTPNPDVIGLQ